MGPETARKEDRGNGEVLGSCSTGDGSHIHAVQDPLREAAGQHIAVAVRARRVCNSSASSPPRPPCGARGVKEGIVVSNNSTGDGLRRDPVLRIEAVGTAWVVSLGGELDLYNAAHVGAALSGACAEAPELIVVDLGEVEFIDSTGLGVLIEARTQLDNG